MTIIVVGAGVVGLSTVAALREAGADVVCLEATAAVMGERSAGSSRIFRLAHTAPDLVRFAVAAREGFDRWSAACGDALLDPRGCVVSGVDAEGRARAMAAAGVPHEMVDDPARLRLPAVTPPSPALLDPSGGVVDVDAVRRRLTAVTGDTIVHTPVLAVEPVPDGVRVVTPDGERRADGVVLAAGDRTPGLGAPVGIDLPSALEHHVRLTFPDPGPGGPAWIDQPAGRSAGGTSIGAEGLATYQHRTGPGRWSVGGTVDPALVAWGRGREEAVRASREVLLAYVREHLTVEPTVVEELYCTHAPGTGDGILFRRSGPVLAVYGENLMKFAPVLGERLAAAALDGSTPADLG